MSIRHYQLRCREEAGSNCYHKRQKAGKKIREKDVLIMRQEGRSIDSDLPNGQKPTIPEAERGILILGRDEKLHCPILPGGHGCGQSKLK